MPEITHKNQQIREKTKETQQNAVTKSLIRVHRKVTSQKLNNVFMYFEITNH